MPELAVKIKTAPNNRRTTINGMSHHFFSCFEKRKNSFSSAHMSCLKFKIYIRVYKENLIGDAGSWDVVAALLAMRAVPANRATNARAVPRLACIRVRAAADLEIGDTAGLETCATRTRRG
jgi:hypothetical protein